MEIPLLPPDVRKAGDASALSASKGSLEENKERSQQKNFRAGRNSRGPQEGCEEELLVGSGSQGMSQRPEII